MREAHYLGRTKQKRKRKREKGVEMEPVPPEGAVKEERFPHTGKSHHWQGDQPGQSRSLEASEENTANWFLEGQLERDLHRWLSLLPDSPA